MAKVHRRSVGNAAASEEALKKPERTARGEPKWVYVFAAGYVDGRASMTELLGGKGANLAEMASLGLPVPPGFTITTAVCDAYYASGRTLPEGLKPQVEKALKLVGESVGAALGDVERPLSCRCARGRAHPCPV
jgi:pyruvate,orthophosphate dikinase